jgi:hypothetical protein
MAKAQIVPGDLNAPWEEFPQFSSVSSGWRQSYGEGYWHDWHDWFARKPHESRMEYQTRHPEPDDWRGFYAEREHPTP